MPGGEGGGVSAREAVFLGGLDPLSLRARWGLRRRRGRRRRRRAEGLRPPKCRLGERSVAPRSRNEPLGRSSSLPGPCRGCGSGGRGERETATETPPWGRQREGEKKGGEARASPPGSPPCGRLSAGGYRGGTVPCWRAREGPSAGDGGSPRPPCPDLLCRRPPRGRKPAPWPVSLSPPRPSRAARPGRFPPAVRAVSAALLFGSRSRDGSLRLRRSVSLFSSHLGARARRRRKGERGGRRRRETSAVRPSGRRRSFGLATSDQTWRPAEFKHISQRRKRN